MGQRLMGARAALGNVPLPPGQVVGLAADVLLARLRPAPLPGPRASGRAAGAVLLVAGCAINLRSLTERRERESGAFELEHPRRLVVTGPYAVSRNPMYAGWWLMHLGIGLLQGSVWSLFTTPAAALAEHRGVLAEERSCRTCSARISPPTPSGCRATFPCGGCRGRPGRESAPAVNQPRFGVMATMPA